ncbi:tail assembly protein [Acinetobacter baumannii]|uniref:Tail assembly protein n=5 Tax=Acinetobacter nosocomialis TaxID=106654 RepID=A0AB37CTC2_ACINO|nr:MULTISPECIES: tail assembly protein [Acinetobacter]KCZ28055.1 bacteriophage lambda tail assembly I family protein [Acinetobacter baumannii 25977_9]AJB47682.1 tail protein [Acinetobacter nosocomialis]EXB70872.1 bacteriophage lambda tail assembly I family protein [Acinetobacter sp. 21871]EXE76676.1 bacteriophage lambda tail assembly I family protein [Acinetobacter sp. 1566109]EXR07868.1 bacteriophage lambda tail assembly I family protein [Acinetobacter sp. 1130196]
MLKTIKLYGILGQKFGREFKLDVANTREAMRALSVQIAGFEHFMLHAHEQGLRFAVFLKSKNSSNKRGKKRPAIYDHETKRLITGDNIGEEQLDMNTEADTIHIVPRVMGAGGNNGILQLVLGAILIAASFIPGIGQAAQVALIGAGAGMAMGGVASMLMPKIDNTQDQNQDGNRANKGFGGAVTTVAQGNPVPILYGQREIGGFIISAGQYPEDQM